MWILILQAVTAVLFFLIGYFVYTKSRRHPLNISFGWMCLCIGLWVLTGCVWNYQILHGVFSLLPSQLGQATSTLAASSIHLWSFYFPARYPKVNRRLVLAQLALGLGIAALAFSPASVSSGQLVGHHYIRQFGPLYILFAVYTCGVSLGSLWILARQYRYLRSNLERQKLWYVFLGLLLTLPTVIFCMFILPALGISQAFFLGQASLIIFLGFTAYAIVRYRALDISHFTLKSLGALMITALMAVCLFIAVRIFRPWMLTQNDWVVTGIYATVLFILFALYLRGRPLMDQLIYKKSFHSSRVLERLSRALSHLRNLAELEQAVDKALREELSVERASLYLRNDQDHFQPVTARQYGETPGADYWGFYAWMEKNDEIVEREQIEINPDYAEVRDLAGDYLRATGAELVLPLIHDRRLLGVLNLSPRRDQRPYDHLDLQLLAILRNDIAIALSNAWLFEQANVLYQQLLDLNKTLEQRVSERTSELEQAMTQLRQLDELKSDFITVASHELRTPLTAVKGAVSLALERIEAGLSGPQLLRFLRLSDRNLNRLIQLINDLLDLSKLEAGQLPLKQEAVILQDVCQAAVESLQGLLEAKHMTLELAVPPEPLTVSADRGKLQQVLVNLLHNAIKFSPPQRKIQVRLSTASGAALCAVADQGPGIAPEDQPRLFEKFWKPENPVLSEEQGTGLGLAVAKGIIERHGGRIWVESRPGSGSTFYFSLPRQA